MSVKHSSLGHEAALCTPASGRSLADTHLCPGELLVQPVAGAEEVATGNIWGPPYQQWYLILALRIELDFTRRNMSECREESAWGKWGKVNHQPRVS